MTFGALPVLEIKESGLMKECPRLHISTRHAAVHSFIYILQKNKKYLFLDSLRRIVHAQGITKCANFQNASAILIMDIPKPHT